MTSKTLKTAILGVLARAYRQMDYDLDDQDFDTVVELAVEYDWARKQGADTGDHT